MENFLYAIVAVGIGLIIGWGSLCLRTFQNNKNQPVGLRRQELLAQVRQMKRQGLSFKQRLSYLQKEGCRKDIAEGLIVDIEREQPADLKNIKNIRKSGYSISYPGNWTVRPLQKDLDPEKFFMVESMGSGLIIFSIFNGDVHPIGPLDKIAKLTTKEYQSVVFSPFSQWGPLTGEGLEYSAKIRNLPVAGKVFKWIQGENGFYLMTTYLLEDTKFSLPGLVYIEKNFKLAS